MKNILYIDDEKLFHALITTQLKPYGYIVTAVDNGLEGLRLIENNQYDVILLDINMPEIDGLSVLKKLRTIYSLMSLPIIMLTSEDDEQSIITALHFGANDYIFKPINPEVAAARINTQITLGHYYQEQQNFVQFASHDLKKPILLINDIASMLKTDAGDIKLPKDFLDDLDMIESTCKKMQDIVSGFLSKEKRFLEEPSFQAVDLSALIEEVIGINQKYAEQKQHAIKFNNCENISINTNPFPLRQILDNLIGNAIKFSHLQANTYIDCYRENGMININIKDEGPGLTAEDLKFIFNKQQSLSNKPTGTENSTGIGLYLCKKLIEQLQGEIGVQNNQDKGALFWVKLPVNPKLD